MTTASARGRPTRAASEMLRMINAFLTVQAVHAAAWLWIADRLGEGSRSVDELASSTGAHRLSLHRLLRMLAGIGVFHEEGTGGSRSPRSESPSAARAPTPSGTGRSTLELRRFGTYGAGCATAS
jgi:hypothetical protein